MKEGLYSAQLDVYYRLGYVGDLFFFFFFYEQMIELQNRAVLGSNK